MKAKGYVVCLLINAAVIFAIPSLGYAMAKNSNGTAQTAKSEADKMMNKTEHSPATGREVHVSTTETKLPGDMAAAE